MRCPVTLQNVSSSFATGKLNPVCVPVVQHEFRIVRLFPISYTYAATFPLASPPPRWLAAAVRNNTIGGSAPKLAEKSQGCPVSTDRFGGRRRCGGALSRHPISRRHLPALRRRVFRLDRLHQVSRTQLPSLVPQKRWPWRPPLLFSPLQNESVSAGQEQSYVIQCFLPIDGGRINRVAAPEEARCGES